MTAAALATLNPAALATLADCELRIERGLKSFIDVGEALSTIRDSRLYRRSHATFEDYCAERWNLKRQRAYELMNAAAVVSEFSDTEIPAPAKESHAAALAAVPEADRADVWRDVVESGDKPTAAAIRRAAEARTPTPGPVDAAVPPPADPGATPEPGTVPSTAQPGSGTPAPAVEPPTSPVAPQEPGPAGPPQPSAEQRAALPGAVLSALAGAEVGMDAHQIWARLSMSGVHSSWIEPVLDQLADEDRVTPAGRARRGNRMVPVWLPAEDAKTPEPDGAVAAVLSGSGPTAAAVLGEGGAGATQAGCEKCGAKLSGDEAAEGFLRCDDCDPNSMHTAGPSGACLACDPAERLDAVRQAAPDFVRPVEPPPPATWTPEQHEEHRLSVQRKQAVDAAHRFAGKLVLEVRGMVTTIIDGIDHGAPAGLVTAEMIAECRAALDRLEARVTA